MTLAAIILVLGSGMLHACWNAFTKTSLDKNAFLWWCQWVAIVVFVPWIVYDLAGGGRLTTGGLALVLASMLVHGAYVLLLAAAYKLGDLSQVYPIMRGTSPLLVPLTAVTLLHERLSAFGWLGIALILLGIASIGGSRRRNAESSRDSAKAALLAFLVGVCIAGYTLIDKEAVRHVSPVVLNGASNLGNMLALSAVVSRLPAGSIRREWAVNRRLIAIGGIIAPGGYLLFLYALSLAPVAQLAPMREIGTVFGTLIGVILLQERQGIRRIAASVAITVGVVLLGTSG